MKAHASSWGLLVNAARAAWAFDTPCPWKRAITLEMMVACDSTDTNMVRMPATITMSHWPADRWTD